MSVSTKAIVRPFKSSQAKLAGACSKSTDIYIEYHMANQLFQQTVEPLEFRGYTGQVEKGWVVTPGSQAQWASPLPFWRIKDPWNTRSVVHWRTESLGRLSCLSLSRMGMAHYGPCPVSRHLAALSSLCSEMNHHPLKTHVDR